MSKVKLVGIAPCYNEIEKGHLERFLENIPKVVDGLVLLDDASTDGSYEKMLEVTPFVIKNKKNLFLHEHYNTYRLIHKALETHPDLTHILSLNIDSTFSPACYKDGEALIHKACHDHSDTWDMFTMRNINLWRSPYWWRCDNKWRWHNAERVYIRDKGLEIIDKWRRGLHKVRITAEIEKSVSITSMKGFSSAVSLHWGFESKNSIVNKFHYYMGLENRGVPCPDFFYCSDVFNMLDEFNLRTMPVASEWVDENCNYFYDTRKPKPISYYQELVKYNVNKAECYKNHFSSVLGYYNETEEYF